MSAPPRYLSRRLIIGLLSLALLSALGTGLTARPPHHVAGSPGGKPTTTSDAQGPGGAYEVPASLVDTYTQVVTWAACGGGDTDAQCATLTVPLDYDHPSGTTVSVALKRIPASDGHAEKGVLLTNPGGPGTSGTATAASFASELEEDVRAAYDVVGFDPRGIGDSTQLTCAPDMDSGMVDFSNSTESEHLRFIGEMLAINCAAETTPPELLDFMGARVVAHDMDVIRAVLGQDRLSFLGVSYGTYLGAKYLKAFPLNAGRFVLDSAMDPAVGLQGINDDAGLSVEHAVAELVEHWQASGTSPLTGSTEEAMAQLSRWLKGLDAAPLPVSDSEVVIDSFMASASLGYVVTQSTEYWPAYEKALGQAMRTSDGTALNTVMTEIHRVADTDVWSTSSTDNLNAYYAAICSDFAPSGDEASWEAHAAQMQRDSFFPEFSADLYQDAFCTGWNHFAHAEPVGPVRGTGSGDVLVVGNKRDTRTPYQWSASLADQLDRGHLLTTDTGAHGALNTNACANTAINAFLRDGSLPREGTVCPADPAPPLSAT